MGIDVISWFGCGLQAQMSEEEWAGVMKLQAYRRAAESMVPDPKQRETFVLQVPGESDAEVSYLSLVETLNEFEQAAGDCADCFAPDTPCRRFIAYPIDEMAERFLFQYFLREVAVDGSPAQQIHHDLIAGNPSCAPEWERRAAGDTSTFEAAEPFTETLAGDLPVDSSSVFGALLRDVRGLPAVTAHALFWRGFVDFVPQVMLSRSRGLADLVSLYALFEFTFRRGAAGSPTCDVLFFT